MIERLLLAVLPAASLAAQVPPAVHAVELRITDEKGGPIQAATVQLFAVAGPKTFRTLPTHPPRQLAPKDFTGDHALLADLPDGTFVLRVDSPLHALALSAKFELPAERIERLTVALPRGTTIEGIVKRPDGKPLAEADVRTEDRVRDGNRHPFQQLLNDFLGSTTTATSTRTDAEGRFRLEHVAPGDYRIVANHFAYAPGARDLKVEDAALVKLPAIGMLEGTQVVGTVTRTGKPVAGAEVVFQSVIDKPSNDKIDVQEVYYTVTADASGQYRLPNRVPLGRRYTVEASDDGTPLGKAGQRNASRRPVEVKAGAREQVEDVQLAR